jgi:hypothetical protein
MKKKDIVSKLGSIISEGTNNVTRKTIIENEESFQPQYSGDNQLAEYVAKSISEGSYDVYDYTEDYLLLEVHDLPGDDEVYVSFDMETEINERPYYSPAVMYMPNGDPGYPEEGSDGSLNFNLKKIEISKDSAGKQVLFSGINRNLAGAFETLVEDGSVYEQMSETYWDAWRENQIDDSDWDYAAEIDR